MKIRARRENKDEKGIGRKTQARLKLKKVLTNRAKFKINQIRYKLHMLNLKSQINRDLQFL